MKPLIIFLFLPIISFAMECKDDRPFTEHAVEFFNVPLPLRNALKNPKNKQDIRKLCLMLNHTYYGYLTEKEDTGKEMNRIKEKIFTTNILTDRERLCLAHYLGRYNNQPIIREAGYHHIAELIQNVADREDWQPPETGTTIYSFWKLICQVGNEGVKPKEKAQ
jgi:hypothetical protein